MNNTQTLRIFVLEVTENYFYLTLALTLLVLTCNLLVVISSVLLVRKGQEPRCTYILLGNISLSDLIVGAMAMVGLNCHPQYTDDNIIICIMFLGIYITCTFTSMYSILLIGIDRYLYIIHGLKYKRLLYPKKIKLMIAIGWIIGILLGIPPLLIWKPQSATVEICWYIIVATPGMVITTSVIGISIVFIVILLYIHILFVAIKKVIEIRRTMKGRVNQEVHHLRFFKGTCTTRNLFRSYGRNSNSTTSNNIENQSLPATNASSETYDKNLVIKRSSSTGNSRKKPNKWKAVKVVLFVTGSFVITWMPYLITSVMFSLCDYESDSVGCERFKFITVAPTGILANANSFLNPVIYAWWHKGFRVALKRMFRNRMLQYNI